MRRRTAGGRKKGRETEERELVEKAEGAYPV